MDYYIEEDKTFNKITSIESAEIKCTLSNGEVLLIKIPNIVDGEFLHKGDEVTRFIGGDLLSCPAMRTNEYIYFKFPVIYDENGVIYTLWRKFDK